MGEWSGFYGMLMPSLVLACGVLLWRVHQSKALLQQTTTALHESEARRQALVEQGERLAAESALQERKTELRTILNITKDGFYVADMRGYLLEVNDAYCRLSGYTRDELLRMSIPDLKGSEDPADIDIHITQTVHDGYDLFETRHRRKDGSFWSLEVSSSYSPEQGGRVIAFCRDISERKRVEAELHYFQNHLQELVAVRTAEVQATTEQIRETLFALDRVGMGTIWVDPAPYRITYTNRRAAEMLGYTESELLQLTVADIDPGFKPDDERGVNQKLIQTGSAQFESMQRHKDGHLIAVEVTLYHMASEEGRRGRVVAFFSDITRRKQAEALLMLQATRAQALLELPKIAETVGEQELMQQSLHMLEELTGSSISFLHGVEEDQEHITHLAWSHRTVSGHEVANLEPHRRISRAGLWADAVRQRAPAIVNDYPQASDQRGMPQGHTPLQRMLCVPVVENGLVVLVVGLGNKVMPYTDTDVETVQLLINNMWRTVQKQRTLQRLRAATTRLEVATQTAQLGIWEWDVQADAVSGDERIAQMYDFGPDIDVHRLDCGFWRSRIHLDDVAQVDRKLRLQLEGSAPFDIVFRIHKSDDSIAYIEAASYVERDASGQPLRVVGVNRDITQQKETELALQEAKIAAEAASRAKGDFLANMSHEIRTPLNAVLGFARMGARDSREVQSKAGFKRILASGTHLLGVINDILDFSKIESGKFTIEAHPIRLPEVIANACGFVSGLAQQKSLKFEVGDTADLPQWVSGDAQRLQQILTNLLSNAVKFTKEGGVSLHVERHDEKAYTFSVTDSGIGMTAEQQSRLFSAFEQADSSTTRHYGGTGLGLAISQRLAHLMGGQISVTSRFGLGSTFSLTLPLPPSTPAPQQEREPPPAAVVQPLAGYRVLAAEDVDVNRLILDDLLREAGVASVIFAENGAIAVDMVVMYPGAFDVVLMDVQMPEMDGYEATRCIKDIAPQLPVIGLTAHALPQEQAKGADAGMVDHVTKPIDPAILIAAVLRQPRQGGASLPSPTPAPQSVVDAAPAWEEGPASTGLIDWDSFSRRCGARAELMNKLVELARDGQQNTPGRLRHLVQTRKMQDLSVLAHTVRGVAGNLQAHRLMELASTLEHAANAQSDNVPALTEQVAQLTAQFVAELADRAQR